MAAGKRLGRPRGVFPRGLSCACACSAGAALARIACALGSKHKEWRHCRPCGHVALRVGAQRVTARRAGAGRNPCRRPRRTMRLRIGRASGRDAAKKTLAICLLPTCPPPYLPATCLPACLRTPSGRPASTIRASSRGGGQTSRSPCGRVAPQGGLEGRPVHRRPGVGARMGVTSKNCQVKSAAAQLLSCGPANNRENKQQKSYARHGPGSKTSVVGSSTPSFANASATPLYSR